MKLTLKEARTLSGLTQAEAGRIIGVSSRTISNRENYKTSPPLDAVMKIQDAYAVSYDDIDFFPSNVAPVYKNLDREMKERRISAVELADRAEIPRDVFSHCMSGDIPFMFFYCTRIKKILNTDTPLEVLFEQQESGAGERAFSLTGERP